VYGYGWLRPCSTDGEGVAERGGCAGDEQDPVTQARTGMSRRNLGRPIETFCVIR
jgi:hypothetical protein